MDYSMKGVMQMETKECTRCGRNATLSAIGLALKFFVCDECRTDTQTEDNKARDYDSSVEISSMDRASVIPDSEWQEN